MLLVAVRGANLGSATDLATDTCSYWYLSSSEDETNDFCQQSFTSQQMDYVQQVSNFVDDLKQMLRVSDSLTLIRSEKY